MNLLSNPPFNDSDWFRKDDDVRWQWFNRGDVDQMIKGVSNFLADHLK